MLLQQNINKYWSYLEKKFPSPQYVGKIKYMVIKKGVLCDNQEIDYYTISKPQCYILEHNFEIHADSNCYFRCEVEMESNCRNKIFALTNPIWIEPIF